MTSDVARPALWRLNEILRKRKVRPHFVGYGDGSKTILMGKGCRRGTRVSPEVRFWERVDKTDDCWLWTGTITPLGYASLRTWDGKKAHHTLAHRFSYELAKGKIPDGLELDHLCHVRHCVNPDHLEAVTHRTNACRRLLAAQGICRKAHKLEEVGKTKSGACRECYNDYHRRYWQEHDLNEAQSKRRAEKKQNA